MAQLVTEVVRRMWAEKGQSASETRLKFLCPWGSQCKNAPATGAARPCNNIHEATAPIMTADAIETIRKKEGVTTYRHVIGELMKIYEENLKELVYSETIHENKVNIRVIGRTNLLPERIRTIIDEVEHATKDYDQFYINFALAYGGRAEIVDATREIATLVGKGEIDPESIDEDLIEKHLYTAHLPQPDPDLIIRTSGEARLSNFLIWQAAYSELFIVDVFWPDFREIDLARAIRSYQNRHRRYGK